MVEWVHAHIAVVTVMLTFMQPIATCSEFRSFIKVYTKVEKCVTHYCCMIVLVDIRPTGKF